MMDEVHIQQCPPTSPPRRSLTSMLTPKSFGRPKTPSVIVTDDTTELSSISFGHNKTLNGGGTQESIVELADAVEPSSISSIGSRAVIGTGANTAATGTSGTSGASVTSPSNANTPQSILGRCCHEPVRKVIWGVLIMTSVSAAWVSATHLLKSSFQTVHYVADDREDAANSTNQLADEMETYTYDATFFSTWFVTTWTSLFLPLYTICCLLSRQLKPSELGIEWKDSVMAFRDKGFTLGTFVGRCCLFCCLWVSTNWMYMHALSILNATDVMALFATNVSFVYLLSWVILHDQFVGLRIVAVIFCNTGVALLAYMDGITRSPTLGGVALAASAAAGSAVYKVSFKRIFGEASYGQVSFFFSLIGVMNVVLLWPIVLLLHFTGVEVIIWNRVPWTNLSIAGSLSLVANLLGNFGPALTYEVFIHLGLLLAIPVSAVLDVNLNGVQFEGMKLAGTVMIISGFILVLLPENWPDYLTRLLRWGRQLNQNTSIPVTAPVDLRTGYISRSRLRSPSGRVR